MLTNIFDTHAHYDDEAFDLDRDEVITDFGGLIVNPGCTVESSALAVEMASRHDKMYAAVGIHPENCGDFVPAHIDALRDLLYDYIARIHAIRYPYNNFLY